MSLPPLAEAPWVVFRLKEELYAVEAQHTQEMLVAPNVTHVPNSPAHLRGIINLRGKVMPLVDLRLRLGMGSSQEDVEELVELLRKRETDHHNWLEELESSIREDRAFKLTTDPHACAFGKWYDAFHTDDLKLGAILIAFDYPHKQVHAIGLESREMIDRGDKEGALGLIERTRDGALARMIGLFEQARHMIRKQHTEIAIVLDLEGENLAVTVDSVLAVETLEPGSLQKLPPISGQPHGGLVTWLGQRPDNQGSVLILDVEMLLGHLVQEAAA
jgi:purine-binding chemotaxis protein CheW